MGALALTAISTNASGELTHASDVSLSLENNDNPYKMTTGNHPGVATVLGFDYSLKNKFNRGFGMYADFKFDASKYDSGADNADEDSLGLTTGLDFTKRANGNRLRSRVAVYYNSTNKTYVSRSTGLVPTSGGLELADRFSNDTMGLEGIFDYYVGKDWKFSLDVAYNDREYTDYGSLGLTLLDYSEWELAPAVRYKIGDEWKLYFSLPFKNRVFDDRRAEDINGDSVTITDLEYDYSGYEMEARYQFNEMAELSFGFRALTREDNNVGFRNYDKDTTFVKVVFEPNEYSRADIEFQTVSRDYEFALSAANPLEFKSASGDRILIGYERYIFRNRMKGLLLEVAFESYSADHTTPLFNYDQHMYSVGVSRNF